MDNDTAAGIENATSSIDYEHLTVDLVSAFVSNNSVRAADLPGLITQVHAALAGLAAPAAAPEEPVERATPAQVRKSITPNAIISFIDGKPYKTLKRHLSTHGLDQHSYRQRYGLPSDYPMVASSYAAQRSELARSIGLGQARRKAVPAAAGTSEAVAAAPAARKAKAPRKPRAKATESAVAE